MARIRSIKPEFWSSPSLARVSRDARLTFAGLFNQCDDAGRCEAIPRMLLGALYPFDDDINETDLARWIDELADVGVVRIYENRGRRYLQVTGWDEHQRIDKPGRPRCPDPDDESSTNLTSITDDSRESRETVATPSRDPIDRSVGASERRSVGERDDAEASSSLTDTFDTFWSRYPRHHASGKPGGGGSRKKALDRWRRMTDGQREQALTAVEHYRAWCESPEGEWPAHATTWLNEQRWEQWLQPASRAGPPPADPYDPTPYLRPTARPA